MKAKKSTENPTHKNVNDDIFCSLPLVPDRQLEKFIDPNRLSLIRYNEKKWVNYTNLHYFFLENNPLWDVSEDQMQAVRDAFKAWKDLGLGLNFQEVNDPSDAEIRIGFERGSSWSYVGRDCIDLIPDPAERTMNFGWDLTTPYGKDTALHEIGHALGFPHEHQNPNAGIIWNENAVYNYFSGPPNYWNPDKTHYNVIRKISSADVGGSNWDKDSIMHYHFKAGLIINPEQYQTEPLEPEQGLSQVDIDEAIKFYPGREKLELMELKPYLSHLIDIIPSGQIDFFIKPARTRNYTIQTFGEMDTVIVLFEDINGEARYMDGDDDSGYNNNSQITARLIKDNLYYLRVRLYYSNDSGKGAVMLW